MSSTEAKTVKMLWFTGSSTESLPFIHDSFRAKHRIIHQKPKQRQQHVDNGAVSAGVEDSMPSARRSSNDPDLDECEEGHGSLRLPRVVEENGHQNGEQTSARTSRSRFERDPVSFTSYMRRYKACARLKGISPARAYAATRHRSHSFDESSFTAGSQSSTPRRGFVDSFSTTSVPLSNLRLDQKAEKKSNRRYDSREDLADWKFDHKDFKSEHSGLKSERPVAQEGTKDVPYVNSNGEVKPEDSVIERIEEKLRKESTDDDGIHSARNKDLNNNNNNKGRRKDGRRGSKHGSSGGCGGRGGGGQRPLGGIVSPRRMQELLTQGEEPTLPYTFYRTNVENGNFENTETEIQE